ncbi:MAG: twin-arginine translocase TatA/TatE family subunit [Elusimicrobia bacterium]|nr:twin-arginine translocase TatA/TatE family subunit [Elusimicrobiota bacterium]MDE2424949.1 twin-arginine translocase TatA/TatE family subunit [Elusimicrobiota bacterium]
MGDFSFGEVLVVIVVGLILFGPNKIPEFARQCGRAVNMFKKGLREGLEEAEAVKETPKKELTQASSSGQEPQA